MISLYVDKERRRPFSYQPIHLSTCQLIVDPAGEPAANMARDTELAEAVRAGWAGPTLRIYRWDREAISLGRRQRLADLPQELLEKQLPWVRRPTGGGTVVHRLDEVTYALAVRREVVPPGLRLSRIHRLIHGRLREELIRRALLPPEDLEVVSLDSGGPFSLCFAAPVCGDLLYGGKKVAGAALRAWRDGVLIQGSIQNLPVSVQALAAALRQATRLPFG